jgi:hypothetical protein
MGWTIGVLGFDFRRGLGIFLFTTASRKAPGPTQPPIQWAPGALSPGVKRPGRDTDHSPPFNAEVKNASSYTSTPQYAFMAWCSVKGQGQLYLYFYLLIGKLTIRSTNIFLINSKDGTGNLFKMNPPFSYVSLFCVCLYCPTPNIITVPFYLTL